MSDPDPTLGEREPDPTLAEREPDPTLAERAPDPTLAERAPASRSHDNTPDGWDARYAADDRMWSGQPNGLLVAEVADMPPGRALDVGCGEGADTLWLALRGWDVTAVDVSRVAIDRGRAAAGESGVHVDWRVGDVVAAGPELGTFDLVTAFYPVLPKESRGIDVFLDAVAPGGVLLFVHHVFGDDHAAEHGFDPADFVQPDDVRAALGDGWTVESAGVRDRTVTEGQGAGHTLDSLVRARRH
ncbi:class I SAM-dependent methyltransferase [Mariniluteicoccus flavus]